MNTLLQDRRRTVRQYINELDKSTIISIFPLLVNEFKSTIQPGRFVIHPGTYDKPTLLVVGSSSWWRDIDPDEPLLEIPQHSMLVAEAVCNDYCNGMLGFARDERQPGLFWLPGELTVEEVKTKFKPSLDLAKKRQDDWYIELIHQADILSARTGNNPAAISDLMRLAGRERNIERSWMKDFKQASMTNCRACGTLLNPEFPVCPTCKAIVDPEKAKALGLQFVK